MADAEDDRELAELRELNARIEALHGMRWTDGGPPPGDLEAAIDALERQAAALIRARAGRTLLPLQRRLDATLADAHRLLDEPPRKGREP